MAKPKLAGSRKKYSPRSDIRSALPCLFLVLAGIALVLLVFYLSLKGAASS